MASCVDDRPCLARPRPRLAARLAARLALAAACLLPTAAAQTDPPPPPPGPSGGELLPSQSCYDVLHYDLALSVDPEARFIQGALTMTARITRPSSALSLHLDHHLSADNVRLGEGDGEALSWVHDAGLIQIDLEHELRQGEVIVLLVTYGGNPREAPRPPWDGGFTWSETDDGSPWIATSCQGQGADLWWPCKDHPSDKPDRGMDLRIRVPRGLVVASNGVLVSDADQGDGTHITHWRTELPISNYCVALNIAPYVVLEAQYRGTDGKLMPFKFWVLPEDEDRAREVLPDFVDHMAFFERVCGPYPFRGEKYGVAQTPHLGMEHQSIIAYGYDFQQGTWDYDWLHHHELSHEWWANLVTCRDWKDMWIHEGIGTYMQPLYLEQRFGKLAYLAEMASDRARLRNVKPVAPRESMDSQQIYFTADGRFDNDIYQKGSWIMHSLRWLLGDAVFFETLRRMAYPDPALEARTDGSAARFTDTDEIMAIAERVSGVELGWFEELYLRQPALPVLHVERDETGLDLRWETPDGLPFPMPLPVYVDEVPRRVELRDGTARLIVDPNSDVRVDPFNRVLRAEQVFDLPKLDRRGRPVAQDLRQDRRK